MLLDDDEPPRPYPLKSCEVWIGSSQSNETDSCRLDDFDEDALLKRDGIGVVYIPLAPNEARVPGFDPGASCPHGAKPARRRFAQIASSSQ